MHTCLVFIMTFLHEKEHMEDAFKVDVVFEMESQMPSSITIASRYLLLFDRHGGFTAVNYSIFIFTHPTDLVDASKVSAMQCGMSSKCRRK